MRYSQRVPRGFHFWTIAAALLLLASSAEIIYADWNSDIADIDLEQLLESVVYSASKQEETLEESPANVFVLSKEMIEAYGFQTIGEALSIVPGLYITDDYMLSQIGVRGISSFGDWNTKVLVLLNGRPLVEQYAGTNSIDIAGVNLEQLERIEVIKGPASSLYGSNAFFGLINLVTSLPTTNAVNVTGTYHAESDAKGSSMTFFHRLGRDISIYSLSSVYDRNGSDLYFPEFTDETNLALFETDDDGFYQFYASLEDYSGGISQHKNTVEKFSTHNRINWKDLALTMHYAEMNTGIPTSFFGSLFNRTENNYKERRCFVDADYTYLIRPQTELTARLSYDDYTWSDGILYNYSQEEDNPNYLPGPIWADQEFNTFVSSEVRLRTAIGKQHTFIIGAEVQLHDIKQKSGETDEKGEIVLDNIIPEDFRASRGEIYNLYAQHSFRVSDRLKTVGGLHFNYYSYTSGRVMPKAAVIWNPYRGGTYKLIFSRGFRSPTFYEITFDDGDYYIGNPDLKPELITSFEGIVRHEFSYGISMELAANHSVMNDIILQTVLDVNNPAHPGGGYVDDVSQFRNAGTLETNSVEFSILRHSAYRLGGFANVTYQNRTTSDPSEEKPFNSPRWLANFGLTYQLIPGRLAASMNMHHQSARYTWDAGRLSDETTFDANVHIKRIAALADVQVGIKNLTDEKVIAPLSVDYAPSTRIARPGRSIFVNMKISR